MATGSLISVQEYLQTAYRPDRDYVDGEVVERLVGEKDHSRVQGALVGYLYTHRKDWGIHIYPEQRVQVKPNRFRVPDICVVTGGEPQEQIFTTPPAICIEILSKDDRMSEMQERINDYLAFGVKSVWVIDPHRRKAFEYTSTGMHEVEELEVGNRDFRIPLRVLFEE